MKTFYLKVTIYFISFIIAFFGLSSLDFNRFLKKNKVLQAQILFIVLALALAYLLGSFIIAITYYFN